MKNEPSSLSGVLLIGVVARAAAHGGVDRPDPDAIQSTRRSLAKWVETEQIISKEKEDWQLGREVLEQRIALIEDEVASRRARIAETPWRIAEAQGKQAALATDNRGLNDAPGLRRGVDRRAGDADQDAACFPACAPRPPRRAVEPQAPRTIRPPASCRWPSGSRTSWACSTRSTSSTARSR